MNTQSIVSPESQNVTFVELFFDLIFVFCVTQIVGLLHDGFSWSAVGQMVLVFWLVWWGWTQFTWALNAADTTHHMVELATLFATAVAFFMAVAIPDAFHGRAAWFAVPYVAVRIIGITVYGWVAAAADATQHAAVRTFSLVSVGGMAAVLAGGFIGGTLQYAFWGLAIVLDIIAAAVGGQLEGWNLHAAHFVERHALFVIIALGETLIVAAAGLTGATWSDQLVLVAVLAVAITCALWWTYFPRAKPQLEHALESCRGPAQSTMARDAFSLLHFPMLCGIIAYAAAVQESLAHPAAPLPLAARVALALSVALFVGGMALVVWRATRRLMLPRVTITVATAIGVLAFAGIAPAFTLGLALLGVASVAGLEQREKAFTAVHSL